MARNSDVYELITNKILAELDRGVIPWRRPWTSCASGPLNLVSAREYRGINVLLLELARMTAGYDSPLWATFKQWKAAGGNVRKGEKGTVITFWKTLEIKSKTPGDEPQKIPLLRHYYVFNIEQVDGDPKVPTRTAALVDIKRPQGFEAIAAAELILENMPNRPSIEPNGSAAWYSPFTDSVTLPPRDTFDAPADFYQTAFHELAHSTAHESRVGRTLGTRGTDAYAREELIAEISAAMVLAAAGVDAPGTLENTAAYIEHWRGRLADDPKLIITSAAGAQRAADYIRGSAPSYR